MLSELHSKFCKLINHLYNCGTWGVTAVAEKKMDAFHRKQLKRVLNIKYPTIISNEKLYETCKEKPISQTMRAARWKLFGHILRRDKEIPASKAMHAYYQDLGQKGFKGRRRITLPMVLNRDLRQERDVYLETSEDLDRSERPGQGPRGVEYTDLSCNESWRGGGVK